MEAGGSVSTAKVLSTTGGLNAEAAAAVLEICDSLDLCALYAYADKVVATPKSLEHEELLREYEQMLAKFGIDMVLERRPDFSVENGGLPLKAHTRNRRGTRHHHTHGHTHGLRDCEPQPHSLPNPVA